MEESSKTVKVLSGGGSGSGRKSTPTMTSKQRRVLGEVQLEVDCMNIHLPTVKRLSESLLDSRALKEQFNSTTQQLFKRDQQIEELSKTLNCRNGSMDRLEEEKGKLLGELKQLALEKEQLNTLLQEELDVRKMIQVESQKLIADIKTSYEHKISKLKDEIKTKEEVVSIKEILIKDLEKLIKKLRSDIASINGELQKSRTQERENQGKMSKSFRGSISMIQSQLSSKSSEQEGQIQSLQSKHSSEVLIMKKDYESTQQDLRRCLKEKEEELKEVLGRLEESRKSREDTLLDMHEVQLRYEATLSELREQVKSTLEENASLRKSSKQASALSGIVEGLELDLHEIEKQNDDLKAQLEDLTKEKEDREGTVKHLEETVHRLEGNLKNLEGQKQELYEKTQEYLRKNDEKADFKVAVNLLQEQLEQSQTKLDEVKENLIAERHRVQKLNEQLAEMEKSYGLSKVDVRILTREKTTLELRLARKVEEIEKIQKEMEDFLTTREGLEKQIAELTKSVTESQTKSEKESFHLEQARRMLTESREEKGRLETSLQEVKKELETVKSELSSFDKVKSELKARDETIKKKDEELSEKSRKIDSLQTSVAILREASTVLDTQLREFEAVFAEKSKALEVSDVERTQLSSECSTLREALQKSRIELNEAHSLKAFLERRVSELESGLTRNETTSSTTISTLSSKVEELNSRNAELVLNSNKIEAELENISAEKDHLKTRFAEVNQDNYKLTQELHNCLNEIFELRHDTLKLRDNFKEAEAKAEIRVAELKKSHTTAIQAKDASNIQMQCTLSQQAKLIQFLQDQNEALKEKKKRFGFFSRNEKDSKDDAYQTPSRKGITLPRTMQTPSSAAATPVLGVTPKATPKSNIRPFGVNARQQSALVLGKCDDLKLLEELDKQPLGTEPTTKKGEMPTTASSPPSGFSIKKNLILQDDKQRIDVNCAFHISGDLYLFGCDQGLFSRKGETSEVHVVKIDGIRAVYQMEFISSLNSVLFIEGNEQKLTLASMGMVRSCAEAAECSQPKLNTSAVADLQNCHMFQVRDIDRGNLTLVVTTSKHIHILSWKDTIFVLRQKISTMEVVTCMLMTPCSVIYGAGKIYEIDTKNFQLQEFLDETDPSLYFAIFGGDDLTIPMAILDVSQSNWTPEQKICPEFLICFPTMGIFVDEEGHRTRGEDIAWLKFPQSINYRHPNLYIFHHSSVEIIRLDDTSYMTTRIGMDLKTDDIGKQVGNIPPSTYLPLPTPQYIGKGPKSASIVVTSKDKHKTEIYEIDLDLEAASSSSGTKIKHAVTKNVKKPSSSDSPASSSSSSLQDDETESQLDSSEA